MWRSRRPALLRLLPFQRNDFEIFWWFSSTCLTIAFVAAKRRTEPEEMTIEARLWREVCQHLTLDESAKTLLSILRTRVPLQALVVRSLDRDPWRLSTVAVAVSETAPRALKWPLKTDLDATTFQEITARLDEPRPILVEPDDSPLARVLLFADGDQVSLAIPLFSNAKLVGVALFLAAADAGPPAHLAEALAVSVRPLSVAFENDQRMSELARMREALEADRDALLSRLQRHDLTEDVIGERGGLLEVMQRVEQVARTDAPVLVLGETGSGKEVIARAIHARSRRSKGPVVRVNCGAIPPELVDSELFGHERGAFTGASSTRKGWFERADGGTLFLDEIGELPPAAQVRLLRVLQDGTLQRVGGHQTIVVDVRIVAATHRDLASMMTDNSFRQDLWYRLSVFPILLPPLRDRPQDLPALAAQFADRAGKRLGGASLVPSASDLELLSGYSWPGNVRELSAVIERAAILGNGKALKVREALGAPSVRPPSVVVPLEQGAMDPDSANVSSGRLLTLDEAMAEHIRRALSACHGRIEGPFGAAAVLGINPHTLRARMRKLGIEWSQFRPPVLDLRYKAT